MLAGLRDVDAFKGDVTLTEEGVDEIICHARVVRKIHILSRQVYQFTSDVQFGIYINVCVVIGRY